MLSPVCLPLKWLQASIADCNFQWTTKWAVKPMNDLICLFDQISSVTLICVADSRHFFTRSNISTNWPWTRTVERCFLLGTLYLGSRELSKSRKLSHSTVESGARLSAMNETSFFVIRSWRGSFRWYFFADSASCVMVVCSLLQPFDLSGGFSSEIDGWQFL